MKGKFTRANVRRVVLSIGKAFVAGAVAVVIQKKGDLVGGNISLNVIETVGFAAVVGGLDGVAKVIQVLTES